MGTLSLQRVSPLSGDHVLERLLRLSGQWLFRKRINFRHRINVTLIHHLMRLAVIEFLDATAFLGCSDG